MRRSFIVVTTGTLLTLAAFRTEASDTESDAVAAPTQSAEALPAASHDAQPSVVSDAPAAGLDVRTAGPTDESQSAIPAMATVPSSATQAPTRAQPATETTDPWTTYPWTADHGG